jgi:hypothetical protein
MSMSGMYGMFMRRANALSHTIPFITTSLQGRTRQRAFIVCAQCVLNDG